MRFIGITKGHDNSCKTEQFRVLDDGTNQIMERGTYFCGQGIIIFESRTNFIAFGTKYMNKIFKCSQKFDYINLFLNNKFVSKKFLFFSVLIGHTSTFYSGRYNCTLVSMYRNPSSIT